MRLSATDPMTLINHVHVYFNDEKTGCVKELDTIEGWIDVYIVEKNNSIKLDDEGNPITMRLKGKVEVRLED